MTIAFTLALCLASLTWSFASDAAWNGNGDLGSHVGRLVLGVVLVGFALVIA